MKKRQLLKNTYELGISPAPWVVDKEERLTETSRIFIRANDGCERFEILASDRKRERLRNARLAAKAPDMHNIIFRLVALADGRIKKPDAWQLEVKNLLVDATRILCELSGGVRK